MGCKHRKTEDETTKSFICKITNKSVDNYKCKNCMMKLEDNNVEKVFRKIFGKGFEK